MSDCFGIEPAGCNVVVMLAGDVNGPSNANTVEKLQGRDLAATAPADAEAIVWNASASTWEPGSAAPAVEEGTATFTSAGSSQTITIADQGGTTYGVVVGNGADSDGTQYTCTLREGSKTNTQFTLDLSSIPAVGKPVAVSWKVVTP